MTQPQETSKSTKNALAEQAIAPSGEAAAPETGKAVCAGCGMPKDEWVGNEGEGFKKGDQWFCCEGCAQQTGCECF